MNHLSISLYMCHKQVSLMKKLMSRQWSEAFSHFLFCMNGSNVEVGHLTSDGKNLDTSLVQEAATQ